MGWHDYIFLRVIVFSDLKVIPATTARGGRAWISCLSSSSSEARGSHTLRSLVARRCRWQWCRLAAWTLQSDDGEYFVRYKSFRIVNDYPADYAFVSNGKDTPNYNKTERYLIPYYLDNERMAITDVAAIHTACRCALVGYLERTGGY